MDKSAEQFIKKSEILFKEAQEDIECENYNKAISGYYFSVEALANANYL